MVKNEDKKKRGKGKVKVAPGQKTLDGFGFKSVKVEKKQLESGEIDEYPNIFKIQELEIQMDNYLMKLEQNDRHKKSCNACEGPPLMLQYSKLLMIEYKEDIQDIQDVVTAEGGEETDGLLEQTKEKQKLYLEGGKYVHFAGPKTPAANRVGYVKKTPKRRFSQLNFDDDFNLKIIPIGTLCDADNPSLSESPAKRSRQRNCLEERETFPDCRRLFLV